MNKVIKPLLIFLLLFGIASIFLTFYKTVISRDYTTVEISGE